MITATFLLFSSVKTASHPDNLQVVTQPLPDFNHIIIESHSCNELIDRSGDHNEIEYTLPKDSTLDEIHYKILGDTLVLRPKKIKGRQRAKIKCGYMTSITSKVNLKVKLNQKDLNLICHKRIIDIANKEVKKISLKATNNGRIRSSGLVLDHLFVNLDNSRVELYRSNVKELTGSMHNKSRIDIKSAENISLEKDFSSRINER